MHRIILAALALLWAVSAANAQLTLTGAGKNPAGASYTGPGDIVTFTWWGGFRAYSAATAGTAAINVCDDTGANCSDVSTSASTGALNAPGTHGSNNCNTSGTCLVKTIYDKTGGGKDVTQATAANMPKLTPNALGSSYCMTTNGSSSVLASSGTFSSSQPFSTAIIAKQSNTTGDQGLFAIMNAGFSDGFTVNYSTGGSSYNPYAGTSTATTFTATNWNAIQSVFNGASTINNINGSENTVNAGAQTITTETVNLGKNQGGQFFNGLICEAGYVSGSISSGNRTSLNTNMHNAYGGF